MRLVSGALLAASLAAPAQANDLFVPGNWPALASDRRAGSIGDSLTVLVLENSSASNSAMVASKKRNSIDGEISAGTSLDESGSLAFGGGYDGTGQTSRSGKMVAQISVTVEEVLPNGDLRISGAQRLNINGDVTDIRISGRIRPDDISSINTVLSSRISDAMIDYDGKGFVTRSAKPGIITQIFNFLGLS